MCISQKYLLVALVLCALLIKVDSFVWYSASFCSYKCSGGNSPAPRQYHKVSNGCGSSYGFQFEMKFYGFNFNKCCAQHDTCYSSCNSGKQSCDQKMYSCAMDECNKCTSQVKYKACKSIAISIFQMTTTTGCSTYKREQSQSCGCGGGSGGSGGNEK